MKCIRKAQEENTFPLDPSLRDALTERQTEMKENTILKSNATWSTLRVLMLGYSGANNTGAEALLLADIEDVRAVAEH